MGEASFAFTDRHSITSSLRIDMRGRIDVRE